MNHSPAVRPKSEPRDYEQIVIESVTPTVDGGRFPAKAVVGETCEVTATVFRHGHERVRAVLHVERPRGAGRFETPMALVNPGLDLWHAQFALEEPGKYRFTVTAWTDRFASWLQELYKRVAAEQPDVASEIAEGLAQVEAALAASPEPRRSDLAALLEQLRGARSDPKRLLELVSHPGAVELVAATAPRTDEASFAPALEVMADRERGRTGAWYELFVRSQGTTPGVGGTFADAERRLPAIRDLGFDVVYLAPIHPIGTTNRKGRNNQVTAEPGDPGSPWAIGSTAGGHTAIEPALGTLDDFDRFVRTASSLGLEVALDLAIQCSPDHPWVRDHPDWFHRRPDGTIRFAENPPKKYEDIYPINFDTPDWRNLWEELRRVVQFWVAHGVRIFRVDNPHTKPVGFWEWLIDSIHADTPDVVFLAEAFTRPPMMRGLGKRGFTQSYTYFTWRNTKAELTSYLTELTAPDMAAAYRPNFFVNTPDILPFILQHGGRPAFKSRLVLAATLSPTYGIYSGYELCENDGIPGREEYQHSEKYEIKVRDWQAPGNISDFIRLVNDARRDHPALRLFTNLRFLDVSHDQLIAYVKATPDRANAVIVVVNLDPSAAHDGLVRVPGDALGLPDGAPFVVRDVFTGRRHPWKAADNYVRLDPVQDEPAHLFIVERGA